VSAEPIAKEPSATAALASETANAVIPVRGMTCQSCVRHVRAALEGQPGVLKANVELEASRATVTFDPALTSVLALHLSIESAGYVADDPSTIPGRLAIREDRVLATSREVVGFSLSAVMSGVAASALLVAFYAVVMTVAQGFDAAVELLQEDWYLIGPLLVGFGVQVGLFFHMRRRHKLAARGSATVMTGASTGISGVSMLACCAHHLADLLPFLGLTGAAVFLAQYREEFLVAGVITNLAGIAFMVRMLRRCRGSV
jgi:copper chaperone CopZ